jgi:hypothetical protein
MKTTLTGNVNVTGSALHQQFDGFAGIVWPNAES